MCTCVDHNQLDGPLISVVVFNDCYDLVYMISNGKGAKEMVVLENPPRYTRFVNEENGYRF